MIDPIITQVVGSIILDFGKDVLTDYTKDFFKNRIKDVESLAAKPFARDAVKEAMRAFCTAFLEELQRQGLQGDTFSHYQKPLLNYIKLKPVKQVLSSAFPQNNPRLDLKVLRDSWTELSDNHPRSWSQKLAPQKIQQAVPVLFKEILPRAAVPQIPVDFNWQQVAKQYQERVKAIVIEDNKLRPYFDSYYVADTAAHQRASAGTIADFDLKKYAKTIQERYANLRLDSLETDGSAYNALKLWQMFIPQNVRECREYLPQVYELPKGLQQQLAERGELEAELSREQLERYRSSYREQAIQSVSELLANNNYPYLVILGDPGSGKSTLLQSIALTWAEKKVSELPSHPVPILIELRTYIRNRQQGECKNFLDFINHSSGWVNHLNRHQLEAELKAGNAVMLFDGLDEIFDRGLREDVISQIHNFTQQYETVRAIVTSRVIGYKVQRLRDAGFAHFMLQDLDDGQIQTFIQRWHERTYEDEAKGQRKQERLQEAVKKSRAIRELAGNPLLLTMMAILNRNQELPRNRDELYSQASRLLLHQWDFERQLEDQKLDPMAIDFKDKQAMLRRVARKLQASEKGLAGNIIAIEQLEAVIEEFLREKGIAEARTLSRLLVQQLREQNFILCSLGSDYYAFVHRTFLEYFCAWDLVWGFKETRTLTLEQLKAEVFGRHWRDEAWQEVLRLICRMLDARFVGEILEDVLSWEGEEEEFKNVFLAAGCLLEVRDRGRIGEIDEKVRERVVNLVSYDLPYAYEPWDDYAEKVRRIRTQAVDTVAEAWQERSDTFSWLEQRATKDEEDIYVRGAAVEALAQYYRDDSETLPMLKRHATSDEAGWVRGAAVEALARYYQDDSEILPILKQRATKDEEGYVRRAAVEALVQHYRDDSETLPIIKQCATRDEHRIVREAAVEALARDYRDDSETLPILKQRATRDEDEWVRRAAVKALVQHYRDDSETLPILKQRATKDEYSYVRQVAVEALVQHYRDDSDTLPILKQRATTDKYSCVRRDTVEALVQHYRDDSDTLPILKQCATEDEDWMVRRVAVSALVQHYRDDSETLTLLKQRATSDEDWIVRGVAVQALARDYRDDSETLPWLKQRATSDERGDVRGAAVSALVQHYRDDSDILPILKQRATKGENWIVRQVAVEALVQHYRDDSETLPILKQRATKDKDRFVREAAVEALVQHYRDDSETLPILKQRATKDKDRLVRQAAVEALVQHYRDDSETLLILKQRATEDEDRFLRRAAMEASIQHYRGEAETFELLCICALQAPFIRKHDWDTNPR